MMARLYVPKARTGVGKNEVVFKDKPTNDGANNPSSQTTKPQPTLNEQVGVRNNMKIPERVGDEPDKQQSIVQNSPNMSNTRNDPPADQGEPINQRPQGKTNDS